MKADFPQLTPYSLCLKPHDTKVLVLQNFHRFLNSTEIIQAVCRQVMDGKHDRTFLVVLAPVVQLPVELEKLFVVVEHEIPDRPQLAEIARGIATEESELPTDREFERVIDSAAGLTRLEAENAFSLSLKRHSQVRPGCVWELKTQALKKAGPLKMGAVPSKLEAVRKKRSRSQPLVDFISADFDANQAARVGSPQA